MSNVEKFVKIGTATISIILITVIIFWYRDYKREKVELLEKLNYLEAYGESTRGIIDGKIYYKSSIKELVYNYSVNGKRLNGGFTSTHIQPLKTRFKETRDVYYDCEKGDFFLVLYDKKNPENSFLMLKCPIKTSKDLLMYRSKYGQDREL